MQRHQNNMAVNRRPSVAVVGAGVSGMCAAYGLGRHYNVTLFEAGERLGGHSNTIRVALDGQTHAIDTGFIVFNDRTYPHFVQLLADLGIRSRPTQMSFSVCCERANLEYNGSSLGGLFAQRRNLWRPRFWWMLREIARFNREARALAEQAAEDDLAMTVADFVRQRKFSRELSEHYLLPMGSAIWSCPKGTFASFPIGMIARFFHHHGLLDLRNRPTWRVIEGGSQTYVAALAARLQAQIRLATPIQQVRRYPDRVEIVPRGGPPEAFDHVVLACHSDQALRMLADPTPAERDLLGSFPYERNVAVLHTDTTLLPRRRRAWASWNYRLPHSDSTQATVTYCMNILQHLQSRHVFCVTLNSETNIDPSKILARFIYEHPVYTVRRAAAQRRQAQLINVNRTSYCGAYWGNGFHEDGVVSALDVAQELCAARWHPAHLPAGKWRSEREPISIPSLM